APDDPAGDAESGEVIVETSPEEFTESLCAIIYIGDHMKPPPGATLRTEQFQEEVIREDIAFHGITLKAPWRVGASRLVSPSEMHRLSNSVQDVMREFTGNEHPPGVAVVIVSKINKQQRVVGTHIPQAALPSFYWRAMDVLEPDNESARQAVMFQFECVVPRSERIKERADGRP